MLDHTTIKYHVLSKVKNGMDDDAMAVLQEAFDKMNAGSYSQSDLDDTVAKLIPLLRPECVSEITQGAAQMGWQLIK